MNNIIYLINSYNSVTVTYHLTNKHYCKMLGGLDSSLVFETKRKKIPVYIQLYIF